MPEKINKTLRVRLKYNIIFKDIQYFFSNFKKMSLYLSGKDGCFAKNEVFVVYFFILYVVCIC